MHDFYKYHALGNDYLVIDPNKLNFPLNLNKKNIRLICHRNYGIGSNGILYGPIMNEDKITFKIFNPDSSEAEKSGNGIRIFALYVWDHSYIRKKIFDLYTKGGKVSVKLIDTNINLIKVNMGKFSFMSNKIPTFLSNGEILNKEIELLGKKEIINCVNIGNPHCVILKEKISEKLVKELGSALENNKLFPNRINTEIIEILDRSNIKIEIWERGVGYTLASGTSSSAASCVAHKLDLVENNVTVHMVGGKVNIEIIDDKLNLTGKVKRVFKGNFTKDLKNKLVQKSL